MVGIKYYVSEISLFSLAKIIIFPCLDLLDRILIATDFPFFIYVYFEVINKMASKDLTPKSYLK